MVYKLDCVKFKDDGFYLSSFFMPYKCYLVLNVLLNVILILLKEQLILQKDIIML